MVLETEKQAKELLKLMGDLDKRFAVGENALKDPAAILDGYKWIFSITQVAMDVYVWGDKNKPRFVEIVGPYKKWGGDNSDAFYFVAPIDPSRTYRVTVDPGEAVYLSLTIYGGPDDGSWSNRIVGTLNTTQMKKEKDGTYSMILSPNDTAENTSGNFIKLESDAVIAVTRDYMNDPFAGEKARWNIECLDPAPDYSLSDEELAKRFQTACTWVKEQSQMVPIGLGETNHVDDPYEVPEVTRGWAAGDAAYAMGAYELEPDEALIMKGSSPECVFWNVCLWNQFLHTYNYDYDEVTTNGSKVELESDGSWEIVIAHSDPGAKNWISTQKRPLGRIWFRWFLPESTPERIETEVVKLADLKK